MAVCMIVVTHWHDDHIRGIAQLVRDCPHADFVCPAAFRSEEFLTLVAAYADGAMMLQTGIQEMAKTLAIVKQRGTTARLASENKLLLRRHGCELWALSPSDAATTSALMHLAAEMPRPMQSKAAVAPPMPNHLSVALHVQLEDTAILLGGDVLRFSDRDRGWLRIADLYAAYGYAVSDVVKVPHHGSVGADCNEMWEQLLGPRPSAALTPFCRGRVALPDAGDIARVCARTAAAYLTAPPRQANPPRRPSAVEKTVAGLLRNRRLRSPRFGRVTLRSASDQRSNWTAELAGAAHQLNA